MLKKPREILNARLRSGRRHPRPNVRGGAPGVFGSVGARSASTNAQGFHGLQKSFYADPTVTLPGQNVMLRVSGTLIVPVELQEFDIE